MISADVKSEIASHLGYGGYGEECNEIGLMLRIPCGTCSGKGHKEYNRVLDSCTSLDDIKCRDCDGKGHSLQRVSIDNFFEIVHIMLEKDYGLHYKLAELIKQDIGIQEAIIGVISKNAVQVIDSLKNALVKDVMET